MALGYASINVELREISLRDRPKELYKASKKGTVPVLITVDGLVIDESLEIMLWTLKNNLNQTWLIENDNEEIEMINRNDVLFKKWLDRYKYNDRYPENSKEYYQKKCDENLSSSKIVSGKCPQSRDLLILINIFRHRCCDTIILFPELIQH